jgi:tetratricopeptide (TPR) repeat protein
LAAFYHAKGSDEIKSGQHLKAEESLKKAIGYRDDIGKYKSSLGYCYLKAGDKERAEHLLFIGQKESPWWFKGNKYLADYLFTQKRFAEALVPLKQMLLFDTNEAIDIHETTRERYMYALKYEHSDTPYTQDLRKQLKDGMLGAAP